MFITTTDLCVSVALLIGAHFLLQYIDRKRSRSGLHPLPGPPGLPLLGNINDIPPVDSHLAYVPLSRKYGPIMQLKVLNQTIVVISDLKIALDLLEKRGAVYSGRPNFYMAWEAGFTWHFGLMPPNDAWRVRRQLVHHKFRPQATAQMHALIRRTTLELARNLLRTPERFREHVKRSAAANIMKSVYGITVADLDDAENDPYVEIAEKAMDVAGQAILPGRNHIDTIPLLRFIPAWIPWLGSSTSHARSLRKDATDIVEVPFARAKDDLNNGRAQPCMVQENLELMLSKKGAAITEKVIKDACAISYLGGADTTVGTLLSFVMAMVLWPEYQHKAQAELDHVVGDRLPEFADQAALPYVEAIVRETYRRFPVAPLGLPRAVQMDDEYEGYFIEKGSTVMANVWDIMQDEATYPDGGKFNPDRWLTKDGRIDESIPDPRVVVFGFGRRICPGRHFADASVFITVATLLKCFEFGVYRDPENGAEIPPSGEIHTGIVSCPVQFKCTITPRMGNVEAVIDIGLATCGD